MKAYGFFYNPMVYESAPALVSLHKTKSGAWKALRRYIYNKATEERAPNPYSRKNRGSKGSMDWAAWFIKEVEIHED